MAFKCSGGSKLTELVSDHIFSNVHGDVFASVMNGKSVSDEFGEMVEERLQVLTTFFSPFSFIASTFL